jgi:acetyl esterase/lipase
MLIPLCAFSAEKSQSSKASNEIDDEDGPTSWDHASLPANIQIVRDVPYGSNARQRFDVYRPALSHGAPVIFMVHGGGWSRGDKASQVAVEKKVKRWVPKGFILISTNYRLLPQADPKEQARDIARAIAVAQDKAASWGGDRSKFIVMGHSAGAHLVLLLATDHLISSNIVITQWLGIISLDSSVYNVVETMERRHPPFYDKAFGRDPAYWKSASPFHALTKKTRPILTVCSTRSNACRQARRFAAKAASLRVPCTVLPKDLSHREINQRLGEERRYTAQVESFMASLDKSVANKLTN